MSPTESALTAAPQSPGRFWPPLLALVIVWQAAAILVHSRYLPGPAAVASTLLTEAVHGPLLFHLGVSLARVAVCFVLAMAIGVAAGILVGRSPLADRWLTPLLIVLLNVPALVLIILCYVWLGLVETALLVAVSLNKIPMVALTIREGARALDRDYAEVGRVYRFGALRQLRLIVLPQLAPFLLAAARNGLALIWKIVLVVELLGRSNGVGFQLQTYFQLFDIPRLLAYSLAFIACVMLIEFGPLALIEQRVGRWRR